MVVSAVGEDGRTRHPRHHPRQCVRQPGGGAIPYQWNRHRGMHVREGHEPFEEAARRVYWDMAIYDKEAMELLIKRIGVDNILFATEMFGAVNAIDPKTGRNFEEIVPIFQSIEWLSDAERYKLTEGN